MLMGFALLRSKVLQRRGPGQSYPNLVGLLSGVCSSQRYQNVHRKNLGITLVAWAWARRKLMQIVYCPEV